MKKERKQPEHNTGRQNDSFLVAHARRELEIAKAFEITETSDGSIGRGVLAMIKLFDKWCNGNPQLMELLTLGFNQIVTGELLSPPTTNPDEWEEIQGATKGEVRNKRSPFYVSRDGGVTWMHLSTKESGRSKVYLKGGVPENAQQNVPEIKQGSSDDNQGSDKDPTQQNGSELDPGMAAESQEDTSQQEVGTGKPEEGSKE